MDDLEARKTEIDQKLQWETSNLARLKESLEKSNTMTRNMEEILQTFDSRLRKLEDSITPVYQETGNLQRRQENIEKTLFGLDHVIGFYHVANEVQPTIKDGPNAGIPNYLTNLGKLQKAVSYFAEDNPGSPEFSTVTTLFETGRDNVEREFRTLVSRHSTPLSPQTVLNLIGVEEELTAEKHLTPSTLELVPSHVIMDMAQMAAWLQVHGTSNDFLTFYAKTRSNNLMRTVKELRDHMKKSSVSSGNVSTIGGFAATNSPHVAGKIKGMKDTPPRRVPKRASTLMRKSSSMIRASMATLESGVSGTLKRQSVMSVEQVRDEDEYDQDIYLTAITAVLKLIQAENFLLKKIVPSESQRKIFDLLIQQAIESIVTEGEYIALAAKKCINKHEYITLLSVFPVVKHLQQVKMEFDLVLEGCQAMTRAKLPCLVSNLNTTGAKALELFIDNIKNDPDKQSNMPRDGTVHELTNNVIIFLEQLMEYTETAGAMILAKDYDHSSALQAAFAAQINPILLPNFLTLSETDLPKPNFNGEQNAEELSHEPSAHVTEHKSRRKLAEYITKVLSALGLNLNNKADTYNDPVLRAVFMLNNYNYILKSMKRSHMMDLVHVWNPDVETYYDQQLMDQKRLYSRSWSKVLQWVMDSESGALPSPTDSVVSVGKGVATDSSKLQGKEREAVKEKFKNFNREMEDILRIQKTYVIPDMDLRQSMTKDNKRYIAPKYKAFLDKYGNVNFSKNVDKYIKYTVDDVKKMIDLFFEGQ